MVNDNNNILVILKETLNINIEINILCMYFITFVLCLFVF